MGVFDLFRLDGQTALITGGGGGLGSAMALAFAEAGADVAVVGRTRASLEEVRAGVSRIGRRGAVIIGDVTQLEDMPRIVDETVDALGGLTILVNNVGGLGSDSAPRPAMELDDDAWVSQIDLNLTSVWRMTRAAVPHMSEGGAILNISSVFGFKPKGGAGGYSVAKAGLNHLTQMFAQELAPRFRVNGIAPGPVPTPKFREKRRASEDDFPRIAREWGVALERLGTPEEIAAAALFLASPAGSWITGQTLLVAGGM